MEQLLILREHLKMIEGTLNTIAAFQMQKSERLIRMRRNTIYKIVSLQIRMFNHG